MLYVEEMYMGSYAEYKERKTTNAQATDAPNHQEKSAYQQYKERKKTTSSGYSVDTDYQSLMTDYKSFVAAAQTDSTNVGYGNARGYLEGRSATAKDLRDRANKLALYLHSNQDALDAKVYENAISDIETVEKEIGTIMDYFGDNARYFSQWATEDDYNAYIANNAAVKQVLSGYDKTAHAAEAQAGWEDYNATQKQIAEDKQKAEEDKSWFDKLGEYLGGAQDTSLPVHLTGEITKGVQEQDKKLNSPTDDWTEDQKLTFGYLWKTNRQKAWQYGRMVNTERNRQAEQAKLQQIQDTATKNFGSGVAHTVGSVLSAPLGLADTMGDMIEMGALGHLSEVDGEITPNEYSEAVKGGITQHLNEKGGTLSDGIPIIGGKGWGDVYGLGTSIAQSMLSAHTGGAGQALITSFGPAVQSGIESAKSRGATDEQAMSFGLMSGLAEALAEQIGVDNLLKIGSASTLKELSLNILKQGAAEGLEEGITSLATSFADQLVMKDKSEYNLAAIMYMSNGMSKEEAEKQAWLDMAEGILFDMLAGFTSGGISGGLETGVKSTLAALNKSDTSTPATPENAPSANPSPEQAPSDVNDLVDSAIASIHNAPSDPINAAVEAFKATGTVTNSQARDILNNGRAVTQLIQQTGIKLPDTASGRRAAVKEAVTQMAQQSTEPIDTAQNTDYDNKNDTGGTTYAQTGTDNTHSARPFGANNEFAGVQAESRGASFEDIRQQSLYTDENETVRTRLSAALAGELERRGYRHGNADGLHLNSGRGQTFEVLTVDANTFHDIFEVARKYTRNGELVDLHSVKTTEDGIGYEECENYLSADGMSGFCITPDGDLISVFNADASKKGFLRAIAPVVKSKVKTLDCYMSQQQPLHEIYEKVFGMKVASVMDHNMDYDHDGIAANHNNPKVAFMVNSDKAVEPAFFGKDDYDAAKAYRDSLMDGPTNLAPPPPTGPTEIGSAMPHATGGSKVSKLYSNTYKNATGEAVQGIGQWAQELDPDITRYDPVSEKETFSEAVSRANSPEARAAEIEKLLNKDGWTGADNDTAYIILDKLRQKGDTVSFAALAAKQRSQNTTAGQLIQSNAKYSRENLTKRTVDAFDTLSDMTEKDVPKKFWKDQGFRAWKQEMGETILDISNQLEDAAESGSVEDVRQVIRSLAQFRHTTAWLGLSDNLAKVAERALNSVDADTAKALAMAQLSQIPEDFRKRPVGQIIETIRVHNMLAALTTVGRNLFGNAACGLTDALSDSTVARGLDILASKVTGRRTIGNDVVQGKAYLEAGCKAAELAALCVELDIPMDAESRFTEGFTRTFSPQGGPATRLLGAYEKVMRYNLEVTDQFFFGGTAGAVDQSLQKLGAKAKLTDAEREELARQTGLRRTFKEDRALARGASKIKQGLNEFGGDHIAMGNMTMPFARTGSNVTQTGADYTGAGIAIGLKELIQLRQDVKNGLYGKDGVKTDSKTGKKTTLAMAQRRAVANMGRGLTGVGLTSLFTAAAIFGILKVHDDKDKDAKALDQSDNLSGAQLNLSALLRGLTGGDTAWLDGDCTVSMDFLEPFNSQMYLGYALSQEENFGDAVKAYPGLTVKSLWQSMLDMPMAQTLSNIENLFTSDNPTDAAGQLLGDYASGFVPSWMRQTAYMADPYYRDTSGDNVWEKAGKQILSRIPFASQTLPKKLDGLGREQLRHEGGLSGFFNTYINPGKVSQISVGNIEKGIDRIAEASGKATIYPNSTVPTEFSYQDDAGIKQTVPLEGEDREIYQQTYGETVTLVYGDLLEMDYFNSLDGKTQASIMESALDYATKLARASVSDYSDIPEYIREKPQNMSVAEALIRNKLIGTTTTYTDIPISSAVYVDDLLDGLKELPRETKADGTTYANVRDIQKMEAIVADDSLSKYVDDLLRDILDAGPEAKYEKALDAGYTAEQFVGGYRQYLDIEGENKKQSIIRYCQREMGMSYAAAKKLYDIYSSKTADE